MATATCGFQPADLRYAPCTREAGHDGPCAHPFARSINWGFGLVAAVIVAAVILLCLVSWTAGSSPAPIQKVRKYALSFTEPVTLNLPAGAETRFFYIDNQDNAAIYVQLEVGSKKREHRTFQVFQNIKNEVEIPAGAIPRGSCARWGGVAAHVYELPGE